MLCLKGVGWVNRCSLNTLAKTNKQTNKQIMKLKVFISFLVLQVINVIRDVTSVGSFFFNTFWILFHASYYLLFCPLLYRWTSLAMKFQKVHKAVIIVLSSVYYLLLSYISGCFFVEESTLRFLLNFCIAVPSQTSALLWNIRGSYLLNGCLAKKAQHCWLTWRFHTIHLLIIGLFSSFFKAGRLVVSFKSGRWAKYELFALEVIIKNFDCPFTIPLVGKSAWLMFFCVWDAWVTHRACKEEHFIHWMHERCSNFKSHLVYFVLL